MTSSGVRHFYAGSRLPPPPTLDEKKDVPCLTALRILLGDRAAGQSINNNNDKWLSPTRELRLVSFDVCNACRGAVPCRVWVGQNTPRSLWARKSREEQRKGGNACQLPPSVFTSSNDSRRRSPPTTRRTLLGVRASTVVWDRPYRDVVAARTFLQGVVCLRFGFHFNEPLVIPRNTTGCCSHWPETLVTLDLGPRFQ
ncbi:unnamed protein product, partial [Ectocarpus fasciculatus]